MKHKIIAAAVLVIAASMLAACSVTGGGNEPSTLTGERETESALTAFVPLTELISTSEEATQEETSQAPTAAQIKPVSTTEKSVPTTKKPVATTEKESEVVVPQGGVKYTDTVVEKETLKYGVVVHKYKTIYYQIINGEKNIYDSKITSKSYSRSGYSASYEDLLPAARENREIFGDFIEENLKIINGYRAEKGVAPLKLDEKLTLVACARAEEIAWSGVHSHKRPDGTKCFSLFREAGYSDGVAGENLGYVFDSPEDVCLAWKNSRTHYENLTDPDYTIIGIGVAADPDETGKLCWVNHFMSN